MAIVAKYSLNGNANDSAGSNNGTASNVTYVSGKSGGTGIFNGSSSKITLPNNLGWNNIGDFSASILTKTTSNPANNRYLNILSLAESSTSTNFDILHVNEGGVYKIGYGKARSNTQGGLGYIYTLQDGRWHNIVATSSGGATQRLYIDGVEVASGDRSGNGTLGVNGGYLGRWCVNDGNFYNGLIDEVEIHNAALTAAQIKNKYLYYNGFM